MFHFANPISLPAKNARDRLGRRLNWRRICFSCWASAQIVLLRRTAGPFQASGGIRPSPAMSLLAAAVGIGMLLSVVMFFVAPPLGIIVFVGTWLFTVVGIIVYHVANALSPRGVHHTQFDVDAHHDNETPLGR